MTPRERAIQAFGPTPPSDVTHWHDCLSTCPDHRPAFSVSQVGKFGRTARKAYRAFRGLFARKVGQIKPEHAFCRSHHFTTAHRAMETVNRAKGLLPLGGYVKF